MAVLHFLKAQVLEGGGEEVNSLLKLVLGDGDGEVIERHGEW
jgi:hypothetical protein